MSNEEVLDSYLNKGGIYLEIYYLLLKLAKPDSGRYRLKMPLDEVFLRASNTCNEICKLNHPEANFDSIWYGVRNDYRRYETDLIFSVVYTLLKTIPVKGKNFIAVFVEIEEKNSKDSTYFPHFKELTEKWLKEQKQPAAAPVTQVDALLRELDALRKENEMYKLRNADLEEKNKDLEFMISRIQGIQVRQQLSDSIRANAGKSYSFDTILSYAKSRQSYTNSVQILDMLYKFLRKEKDCDKLVDELEKVEQYLLNKDGGITLEIDKNFAPLTTNEAGGYIISMQSKDDMEQLKQLLMSNGIKLIQ